MLPLLGWPCCPVGRGSSPRGFINRQRFCVCHVCGVSVQPSWTDRPISGSNKGLAAGWCGKNKLLRLEDILEGGNFGGKWKNFVGLTDRQTDRAGYIGAADRQGGSKKTLRRPLKITYLIMNHRMCISTIIAFFWRNPSTHFQVISRLK